jgi:drug/metabolite transporter (DMT)-like permease
MLEARGQGILQTALASVLWGTVFVASDIGLEYTNPYTLVFMRFLLASGVIAMIAVGFDKRLRIGRELRKGSIWLLGMIDAAGFLLQYVGQSLTNAPDATLLANLAPVLVPLVGWILVKESISKIQATAGAFGLSGLLFIATPNLRFQVSSLPGDLLLLGASLSFALFIVLSKRVKAVSAGSALAVIVAVTVFLTPAALTLGRLNPFNFTLGMAGWSSALYMGAMCTVTPMVFYLRGLRSISASESGTLLLLEVLSGLILAVFVLGQVPTQYEIAAGAAIISALAMSIIFKQKSA